MSPELFELRYSGGFFLNSEKKKKILEKGFVTVIYLKKKRAKNENSLNTLF